MDIFHSGSRFEPTVQIESGKLRMFDFSDLFSIFPDSLEGPGNRSTGIY